MVSPVMTAQFAVFTDHLPRFRSKFGRISDASRLSSSSRINVCSQIGRIDLHCHLSQRKTPTGWKLRMTRTSPLGMVYSSLGIRTHCGRANADMLDNACTSPTRFDLFTNGVRILEQKADASQMESATKAGRRPKPAVNKPMTQIIMVLVDTLSSTKMAAMAKTIPKMLMTIADSRTLGVRTRSRLTGFY